MGISPLPSEIYEREGERLAITARGLYLKHRGSAPNPHTVRVIVEAKERIYDRIFRLNFYPGAWDLVTQLKNENLKLGLVSGSTSLADHSSVYSHFLAMFDVVITGQDSPEYKPAPVPYLLAVDNLKLRIEDCLAVENSPLGIRSALAANLTCYAVKNNSVLTEQVLRNAGAQVICKDLGAIARLLAVSCKAPYGRTTSIGLQRDPK
jgi:beta-phosphoglucomutase-like phosphatase (HAD superfamily)